MMTAEDFSFAAQLYFSVCTVIVLATASVVGMVELVRRILDVWRNDRKRKEDAE